MKRLVKSGTERVCTESIKLAMRRHLTISGFLPKTRKIKVGSIQVVLDLTEACK